MTKPGKPAPKPSPVRQPVLLGLFTGTAIGAGYLLAGVPNVELMTLIVALAGVTMGPGLGAVCGAVAALAYSLGSPFGVPVPLLLVGQVLGLATSGIVGGVVGPHLLRSVESGRRIRAMAIAGGSGLVATFVYDLFTNLAIIGAFDMTPVVVLTGAVPFVLIHLGFNTVIFSLLLPILSSRLHGLMEAPLRGQSRVLLFLLCLGSVWWPDVPAEAQESATPVVNDQPQVANAHPASTPSDSLQVLQPKAGPLAELGWERPLWSPFAPSTLDWLKWYTNWVVMQDGGLGAAIMVLGEASTVTNPDFERDGVLLGTGHVMADDPWLVSNQGVNIHLQQMGIDQRTGGEGVISLATDDRSPGKAISIYRGVKGPHESYQRGISLLTPRSAWRVAFEFAENLDIESYNFTDEPDEIFSADEPYPGHSRIRSSRTRLIRNLDNDNSLALEYTTGRKTKDSLPTWGAEHQEIWDAGAAATMKARLAGLQMRTVFHWDSRDVQWGDRPTSSTTTADNRLLETLRQGVAVDLVSFSSRVDTSRAAGAAPSFDWHDIATTDRTTLALRFSDWRVDDPGAAWVTDPDLVTSGTGQTGHLFGQTGWNLGSVRLQGGLSGWWDSHGGATAGGVVSVASQSDAPLWKLELTRGGRAPRSDELLTPVQRDVNGRELFILPNLGLDREKTWRLQALAGVRLVGFDLAIDGSVRQLRNGITWVPLSGSSDTGRWSNSLGLNSSRLTGSLGRQGRFLGWGRIKLEGTWQSFEETVGTAVLLPPDQYLRLVMMWENHFFKEDGILQLALFSTHRAEMSDPWDLTRTAWLPAATMHDLVVGFRLVGANISLAIRNLTDKKVQLTSGSYSNGLELNLRLNWVFHY